MSAKKKTKKETKMAAKQEVIVAYKGFASDLSCSPNGQKFQYEIGKTYTMDGEIEACSRGFHACEHPLDVFGYYTPAESRYCLVEQSGKIARHIDDSKIASSSIAIKAELNLPGIIKAAIEYTFARVKLIDPKSPAFNSGYGGASMNSGDYGASTNSGDYGASTNSGSRGASMNSGEHGVAAEFNGTGKARSCASGAIVCINRAEDGSIRHIRASKVGENGVKPDVWYTLDADGEFIEVQPWAP